MSDINFRPAKPLNDDTRKGRVYYSYTYKDDSNFEVDRIPESGADRVPENASHRIPENGSDRIPENGSDRIPENGTDRMFGELGIFLREFMKYKNIQTPWNLSGFTKTDEELIRSIVDNVEPPIFVDSQ